MAIAHSHFSMVLTLIDELAGKGAPLCVALYDEAGQELAFLRMDNAPPQHIRQAKTKALKAARCGMTNSVPPSGGAPVLNAQKLCCGGLGVCGRSPEENDIVARRLAAMMFLNK